MPAFVVAIAAVVAAPALAQNGRGAGNENTVQLHPMGVVPGQYIVVLEDDGAEPVAAARAVARAYGLRLGFVYSSALKGFSAVVPHRAVSALSRDPRVAYVEADQWVQAFQTIPTGVQRIFADDNANIDIDGTDDVRIDVDVAVLDTGIWDHPDLNLHMRTDCTGNPFTTTCDDNSGDDGHGHGTHVAGTIGAIDNGIGVVGVAPGARLWAVKVLKDNGSGWMSNIIAGVDWVTNHSADIDVANMSLGGGNSDALCAAINNSVGAGVTYAVAAGNEGVDAANTSPANCDDVITVSALADFDGEPGALAGATCRSDEDDTLANFSNYGSTVDITAPGVCITSTWNDGGTNTISGTSMASPHVAGAAALLAASDPASTPAGIRSTLVSTGNGGWTDDSGDGIQERLLDVGSADFTPATEPGDGGGGESLDNPPSASWVNPQGGDTVAGTSVTIQIDATDIEDGDATLNVEWRVDGGAWQTATYNDTYYEANWNSTGVADGNHTLGARATDSSSQNSAEAGVTVTVDNVADPAPADVARAEVVYATEGGKNSDKHLNMTVTAYDGDNLPVSGATISVQVDFDVDPDDGSVDASATGGGTTDSTGSLTFSWKNSPSGGCYTTDVGGNDIPETDPGTCK
jgi:subtilisin